MNLQNAGIWCFALAGITLIVVFLEIFLWDKFASANLFGKSKNRIRK
jgi:hypothetical protein